MAGGPSRVAKERGRTVLCAGPGVRHIPWLASDQDDWGPDLKLDPEGPCGGG